MWSQSILKPSSSAFHKISCKENYGWNRLYLEGKAMKKTALFNHLDYGGNSSGLFYISYLIMPSQTLQ